MEEFQRLMAEADRYLLTADHLCYVTYPLMKDPKLMMIIAENIYLANFNVLNAIFQREKMYKQISIIPETFEVSYHTFKTKIASRYNILPNSLSFMQELKELVDEHKKRKMGFVKDERYVIWSSNNATKTIRLDLIKSYLSQTRDFLEKVNIIINKK